MTVIGELAVNAVVRTEGVSRGCRAARAELSGLQTFAKSTSVQLAAVGAAAVAAWRMFDGRSRKFDELVNSADRLSIGAERLQELNFAAGQMSNVENLAGTLGNVERKTSEAAAGVDRAASAVRALGLDAQRLAAMPVDEQLLAIADAMRNVREGDQASIAKRLGIDSDLLPMLRQGRAGIEDVTQEARELGIVLDETSSRSLADVNDSLDRMYTSLSAAGDQIAAGFAPAVGTLADVAAEALSRIDQLGERIGYFIEGADPAEMAGMNKENAAKRRELMEDARAFQAEQRTTEIRARITTERAASQRQLEEKKRWEHILAGRERVAEVKAQVRDFGKPELSDTQQEIERVRQDREMDPWHRTVLLEQLDLLDRKEQAQARINEQLERDKELSERARDLVQSQLTPLERYGSKLKEISELAAAGKLTPDQIRTAATNAEAQFRQGVGSSESPQPQRSAPLARFGSVEAFRAIRESRQADVATKLGEKQLKELERGNVLTQKMLDALTTQELTDSFAAWAGS
jgi:hypothetical protein